MSGVRALFSGLPPRTPKQEPSQKKSDSLIENSPVVSPTISPDHVIYEDSASEHSSEQENQYDYNGPTTTAKRGNLRFPGNNSSIEDYDSDFPDSAPGMSLLLPNNNNNNNATSVPPDPPSPKPERTFHGNGHVDTLPTGYPTDLHAICAKVNASTDKLRALLLVAQGTPDVRTVDDQGRLPLHILSNNEMLISYSIKKSKKSNELMTIPPMELDDFVMDLVKSNPQGCVMTDSVEGLVPFCKCIKDWVTLASKGILPLDDDNENTMNQLINAEEGKGLPLEGMERVVKDASRHKRTDNEEGTLGSRSVWTNLTNLSLPSAFKSVYSTSMLSDHGGITSHTRALYRNQASFSSMEDDDEEHEKRHSLENGTKPPQLFFARDDVSLGSFSSAPDGASFDDVFPQDIIVPPVVEWCLKMLSRIVEYFESGAAAESTDQDEDGTVLGTWHAQQRHRERQATPGADTKVFQGSCRDSADWIANTLVSAVSSMPSLMKTLLLLEDSNPAKQRLFNLTIVKRMIYNPHTIGNWLVYMLEAMDIDVAERGVQFLEMLSTNPETADSYGDAAKGYPNKGVPTPQQRLRLYKKVSRLDYLLPAVLALEDVDMVDRVAKTHLMRHIQDCELVQRQTLAMAFFDLWFHIMLLVGFTVATNYFLEGGRYGTRYLVTFYVSVVCVIFRVAWKLAQMASMIKISRSAFGANNFRFGDLFIDWLSIGMVIGGLVWMEIRVQENDGNPVDDDDDRYIRGYLAVTIGMLWVCVLRWFYIINWGVTTFIDMLRQVIKDCVVFFFVLTITILSFANMFYVILYEANGQCGSGLCDKKNVYLEMYSIVLGQFDLNDFTTTFSVVLFVIFTVFVAMVLFYVLIAVVMEAHTKFTTARFSTARPEHGSRARLVYVAHLRAFRRMIEGDWTLMQYVAAILFFAASMLIMVLFLREIREHFDDFYGGTLVILIFAALIVFTIFGILAFVSHMTYFDLTETRATDRTICNRIFGCCLIRLITWPFYALMLIILGVPGEHAENKADKNSNPTSKKLDPQDIVERWGGSAAHIHSDVKRMIESSQEQTKMAFTEELTAMEGRMRQMTDRSKAHLLMEVNASQQRLEKMVAELQSVLLQVVYDPADEDGQKPRAGESTEAAKNPSNRSRLGSDQSARARPPTGRPRRELETIQNDSNVPATPQQDWSVDAAEGSLY